MTFYTILKAEHDAGREEGSLERAHEMALALFELGVDEDRIARAARVPVETVRGWIYGRTA